MDKYVEQLTKRYYGQKPISVTALGGGFYGRVFLVELSQKPYKLVIKIYLFKNLHIKEKEQLEILAAYSLVKIPQVYLAHDADDGIPVDALVMEYIDGINAGNITSIAPLDRERIADQIIENLLCYHNVVHPEGFGAINSTEYEKDWRVYYRKNVDSIYAKAMDMHIRGKISDSVWNVVQKAYGNYDKIFSQPIETARLIHGDYNTWNVLLNRAATEVVAVIDPFNCCWADVELDIYQLSNANGNYFNLLERYKANVQLSSNFAIKNCFYELFSEIMHFYDAHIDVATSNIPEEAKRLEIQLQEFGF